MARSAAPVMFASAESRLSPSPLNWYSALKFNTGRSWLRARSNCSSDDPDLQLLLDDVGLEGDHLGEARVPVGLQPGLGRGGDGDDPAVVGGGQAEDVAQLPLGRDDVGGPGHEIEAELLEPLLRPRPRRHACRARPRARIARA